MPGFLWYIVHAQGEVVRIELHVVALEHRAECPTVGQLSRRADCQLVTVLQEPEPVGQLHGQLYVVRGEENGLLFFVGQSAEQQQEFYATVEVEE